MKNNCVVLLYLLAISSVHFTFGKVNYEINGQKVVQTALIKSPNRRSVHDGSSLIHDLTPCQSSSCQLALNGATYLASFHEGLIRSIFACNGRDIWSVSTSPSGCTCQKKYQHQQPVRSLYVGVDALYWLSDAGATLSTVSTATWRLVNTTLSDVTNQTEILNSLRNIPAAISALPLVDALNGSYILFNLSQIRFNPHAVPLCDGEMMSDGFERSFVYFKNESDPPMCFGNSDCTEQVVTNPGNIALIGNLSSNTTYRMRLSVKRRLGGVTYRSLSPQLKVSTICGVSSPVSEVACLPQSFDRVRIVWSPPVMQNSVDIRYLVATSLNRTNISSRSFTYEDTTNTGQTYEIQAHVVDCPSSRGTFSSASLFCSPFQPPPHLSINKTTSTTISLFWEPLPTNQISSITVLWSENQVEEVVWTESVPLPGTASTDTITDLKPNTAYEFQARIRYTSGIEAYTPRVPSIRTDPGPPSPPSNVQVVAGITENSLTWSPSQSKVDNYSVEARNRSDPTRAHLLFGDWSVVEVINSIGDQRWLIQGLTDQQWYEFRVYASSSQGRGDASPSTPPHKYIAPVDHTRVRWIAVGSSIGGAILLIVLISAYCYWRCRIRRRRRKALKSLPTGITTIQLNYGMDVELARIRQMTRIAMATSNQEGFGNLPSDYRKRLKLFPREKLMLGPLLGSGAFGEVYQGTAIGIKDGDDEDRTQVAVKTLKETASENEKCEFLVEAYFMSLFDHPNIISLLGVCLDNEPQFLILELMKGGDLLKYLRGARPSVFVAHLSMTDLLEISLDLAGGCQYLASKHFIHRDIAARNCLVSTKLYQTETRVVKIGDFGLTRDVYKNDYYYKEGAGMLPVRWMATESLTVKRYTVQSDVWSFGVTLWEILTFGQQPYPVYNNSEVIRFVTDGGRLPQPAACPDDLYDLMKDCWNIEPSQRPTFQKIHETLEHFKIKYQLSNGFSNRTIRLPSGPVSYSTMDTSGPVFMDDATNFFDNEAFRNDEDVVTTDHSTTDVTFSNLSGHVAPDSVHYLNHARARCGSTTDSEYETVCKKPFTETLNYAMMGFPPSRETSVKRVVTHQPHAIDFNQIDETKPLQLYTISEPTSPRNQYVKTPSNSSLVAVFPILKEGMAFGSTVSPKKLPTNRGNCGPPRRKKRQRKDPRNTPLGGGCGDVSLPATTPADSDATSDDVTRSNFTFV